MPPTKPKDNIEMPSKKQLSKLIRPYSDEELSGDDVEAKVEKLMKFFDLYGIDYDKYIPNQHPTFNPNLNRKAYPNYDQYMYVPGQHDTSKWLKTVKEIHYKQQNGFKFADAIQSTTQNWPKMEVHDFLNWLKFYEESAHMKYKFANVWYENGQPGYFLHVKQDSPNDTSSADDNAVNEAHEESERNEEKKRVIEKQRQKIIGRLDSAEKLLRTPDGQMFAGPELEMLMEAIYNLKKKVQLVNKISSSIRLYEDMIVREANILNRKGFFKASNLLYSVAQEAPITPTSPPDPSGAGNPGNPGTLPAEIGIPNAQTSVNNDQNSGQPPLSAFQSPNSQLQEKQQPKGIKDFIDAMNDGVQTDLSVEDDSLEVEDTESELLVTEAQIRGPIDEPMTTTPPPEPGNPVTPPIIKESPKENVEVPLEVSENDINPKDDLTSEVPVSDFGNQMDQLMQNVTIADIVAELEDISKDYKTRSQPRRLGKVDMMLDSIGLASLFPSLSEAQNKALEANNYISTRVDDILSKLRGAMANQEKMPAIVPNRPEIDGIKNKLQSDQDKEKQRKQIRKDQENSELENNKETPKVEMGELGTPTVPVAPTPTTPLVPKPLV